MIKVDEPGTTSIDQEQSITPEMTPEERENPQVPSSQLEKGLKSLKEQATEIVQLSLGHVTALENLRIENESLKSSNEELKKKLKKLEGELSEKVDLTQEVAVLLKETKDSLSCHGTQPTSKKPDATTDSINTGPVIGSFGTKEVRSDSQPFAKASKVITFAKPYSAPPGLPIGFTMLNIGNEGKIRATSFISDVKNDRFEINIDSCPETKLHNAACTWLEIAPDDPDFQCGRVSTTDYYPWNKPQAENSQIVTFQRPYSKPPKVVVWLSALDVERSKTWRLEANASDITATGFIIHINTWCESEFHSAAASWVAYPSGKGGVFSGGFTTYDMRSGSNPQIFNNGYVDMREAGFVDTPRVVMALNLISVGCTNPLTIELKASCLTSTGMMWHLDGLQKTVLYGASASYIALS